MATQHGDNLRQQGATPTGQPGVLQTPDGQYWVSNRDGTFQTADEDQLESYARVREHGGRWVNTRPREQLNARGARKVAEGVLRTSDGKYYISDQKGGWSEASQEEAQAYAERRVQDGVLGLGDAADLAEVRSQFATEAVRNDDENEDRFSESKPTASDVKADPRYVEAQERALRGLEEFSQGGLRESDKQGIQAGQMMQGQYLRGQREAALDQAEMRGMRGGAAQLASDIGSQQGMAQALFLQNADINNAASDRALQALGAVGGTAQGLRRDDFAERAASANSLDAWGARETNYARQQRAQRQAMAMQREQMAAQTPGGLEEFTTGAAPIVNLGANIASIAAAGMPVGAVMPTNSAGGGGQPGGFSRAPAGPAPAPGINSGYKAPYDDDEDSRA